MRRTVSFLVSVLPLPILLGAGLLPRADDPAESFAKDIKPTVESYCLPCHSGKSAQAGIDLSGLDLTRVRANTAPWRKALKALAERSMPPVGSRRPAASERERLIAALQPLLDAADAGAAPTDPGRVAPRRLNRLEYNNTIRDLLGVDTKPADSFPADGGGGGGFDNNADTLFFPPVLMERYLDAAAAILDAAPKERVFLVKPSKGVPPRAAAKQILTRLGLRAFRRPVAPDEINRLVGLYDRAVAEKVGHEAAVKRMLQAVLVSPNFLFRAESDPGKPGAHPVSDWALASRLSYFLWSSLPDDTLLGLAAQKRLSDPKVLAAQTARMLASPKAASFASSFAGQWLRAKEILTTAQPDPGRFPMVTPALRQAMFDETALFFQSVVQENAPVGRLIDADYTFVNEDLAKLYGLSGVTGPQMRRVRLTDRTRGGVLTQASILTLTSYPQRTSPVLRGKWVMSEVLGAPPPPPPPVVATLSPDDGVNKEGQTLRQRLEKHRENPACKGCHSRIDPMGFGLENFDAIGRWRTQIAGKPVDAVGTLTTGETFEGVVALKKVLLARQDEVARNLAERLLAYALGRGLEPADLPALRRIVDASKADGYRSQTLIAQVVQSLPFRYRQGDPAKAAAR